MQLAAAVAFFTLLAVGPLVVVVLSIVGAIFGDDAAHGRIFAELSSLTGAESARNIEDIVERSGGERSTLWAFGGTLLFLFSASGIFGQLSTALDVIRKEASGGHMPATTPEADVSKWRQVTQGGKRLVRDRLMSMAMVLVVSFLLVLAIIASSVISVMSRTFEPWIHQSLSAGLLNLVVSMVLLSALSAALYVLLTRPSLPRLSAAIGGAAAAGLFMVLRWFVGLVVPLWASETSFGPAASVVTLLLWAWFSAATLLVGGLIASIHAEAQATRARAEDDRLVAARVEDDRAYHEEQEQEGGRPVDTSIAMQTDPPAVEAAPVSDVAANGASPSLPSAAPTAAPGRAP
jgi:membrane protein